MSNEFERLRDAVRETDRIAKSVALAPQGIEGGATATPQVSRTRRVATGDSYTRVKLCGMFRPQDITAVNAAQPDYVGFVVDFPRSHRSVSSDDLPALSAWVANGIQRVGVFVDAPVSTIARLYEQGAIDIAQLHGHEDEAYLARLRSICPISTIQAFTVRSPDDIARTEASTANIVLLDNGQGTGKAFDWSLVTNVQRPFVLAGGLDPTNVAEAIAAVHPWAVDMSSGLETNKEKDPHKIRAAVAAVRGAQ